MEDEGTQEVIKPTPEEIATIPEVVITEWVIGGDGDGGGGDGAMKVCAKLYGEEFQLGKHPQGTEVKAITYASMQVYNEPNQHEVFVIVDI
ncbi:Protein archease [Portunus trituberculatus]|uniref:Protein archease n=1 Tax=Portunus trituberculatus TaxID=210409 RepID=A0A5B7K572_PORTR|nr:Protein archease [Portunus trituberculatus]